MRSTLLFFSGSGGPPGKNFGFNNFAGKSQSILVWYLSFHSTAWKLKVPGERRRPKRQMSDPEGLKNQVFKIFKKPEKLNSGRLWMTLGSSISCFRRAAAQKNTLWSGAKHSPLFLWLWWPSGWESWVQRLRGEIAILFKIWRISVRDQGPVT